VAKDDRLRTAGPILVGGEEPPQQRLHAQRGEVPFGDIDAAETLGFQFAAGDREEADPVVRPHPLESRRLLVKIVGFDQREG
jgi:hypothetical protein